LTQMSKTFGSLGFRGLTQEKLLSEVFVWVKRKP
jgi:hypothetical protein